MKKIGKITNTWRRVLQNINTSQFNEAIELLDECLLILALATENKVEELDGVDLDLWKMRVWVKLEELDAVPTLDARV